MLRASTGSRRVQESIALADHAANRNYGVLTLQTFGERDFAGECSAMTSAASAGSAIGLLASIRDTPSLLLVLPAFDSLDVAARAQGGSARAFLGRIARAFVALARADSATALRDLLAVPMATCGGALRA